MTKKYNLNATNSTIVADFTYILDTSVLIDYPEAILQFPNSTIVLPITVLSELDKLKISPGQVGQQARLVIKLLDSLNGDFSTGINLENNSILKIDIKLPNIKSDINDDKILACAIKYKNKKTIPVLVSQDFNLRIKAKAYSIKSEEFIGNKTITSDLYSGCQEIIDSEIGFFLKKNKVIDCPWDDLYPNQCVIILDQNNKPITLGRRVGNTLKSIDNYDLWGISGKNREQGLAAELLMDPKIQLVSLVGRSGCGKTLLSLAAGLEMILNKKMYDRLLVYRPIQPLGNDLGYLPGTAQEKLSPWMAPIDDALDLITNLKSSNRTIMPWRDKLAFGQNRIELHPLTYLRGRSIPRSLILLDEAQQCSKSEIKALLTRVSHGTKVILTGDIEQIDTDKLDVLNNGLSYVVEKFKDSEIAGHLTMCKCERSALAAKAAEIL